MQGSSFWKTVAIVGVIGIGSLAILEVQNQLGKQNLGAVKGPDDELAELVAASAAGENIVTPQTEQSDLERMLAAAESSGDPLFDAAEPQLSEPSGAVDATFFDGNSEPLTTNEFKPAVNNTVSVNGLQQGGNPFDEPTDVRAVAANYSGNASNAVEPVGFVNDETFADDTVDVRPFRRSEDGGQPAETPSNEPDFSLFANDEASAAESLNTQATDDTPAPFVGEPIDSLQFFNGGESTEALPAPDSAPLKETAQFYENTDAAPLRPTPAIEDPPQPLFDGPTPERAPALAPTMDSTPDAFPSFPGGNQPLTQPTQPGISGNEEFETNPFPEDFGARELVPAPREIRPEPTQPEFPAKPQFEQPALRNENPTFNNLPPAGISDGTSFGNPSAIPALEESGRTRIPDVDPLLIDEPLPDSNRPSERLPDGDMFPMDLDSNQNRDPNPIAPVPEISQPGTREFNNPLRSNDSLRTNDPLRSNFGEREFNADPRANERTREFSSEPRPAPRYDERTRDQENPSRYDAPPLYDNATEFRDERSRFDEQPRDLEVTPRRPSSNFPVLPDLDSRSRNPNSKPPMRDTSPADYDLSDRRMDGGIRTVSGVMSPNLVLEKTAPENATVGVPLDYKIYVRNEGDATAYDVVVEDEVPTGATIDGARPVPTQDRETNRLVWKFAKLEPNETEEIAVRLTPTGEGTLDGVATVRFKSRVRATTVITAPKLRLEMTGPEEVKLGDEVSYRYVITNEGSGEARDVLIRTLLPNGGGLKHPQGRDLEYEIGTMRPDQQKEIVLTVVAAEPGEYRAEAVASGSGGAKDAAAWRTNIIGSQLQIVRRGPKRRFVGRPAVYENIVSNETNFDAIDARVVEVIPPGMEFTSANKGGKYDPQNRAVTWRLNRLGPGRQEQLQIELIPRSAGQLESAVTIYENAGLQGENYVSTTVVEDLHQVGAQMSQLNGPVEIGESFGFTITIDNRGTAMADEVKLVVDVPRQIKVIGAGNRTIQARQVGSQVQYDVIVRIQPGDRQTFELKLQGTEPVRNGIVSAKVQYRQMEQALVVSETVTVYRDDF